MADQHLPRLVTSQSHFGFRVAARRLAEERRAPGAPKSHCAREACNRKTKMLWTTRTGTMNVRERLSYNRNGIRCQGNSSENSQIFRDLKNCRPNPLRRHEWKPVLGTTPHASEWADGPSFAKAKGAVTMIERKNRFRGPTITIRSGSTRPSPSTGRMSVSPADIVPCTIRPRNRTYRSMGSSPQNAARARIRSRTLPCGGNPVPPGSALPRTGSTTTGS